MYCTIVPLNDEHLDRLGVTDTFLRQAYFSAGSVSYCLLADGQPVLAGGVVNMQWKRGEAWMLPTGFFRKHLKTCLRYLKETLPEMAFNGGFKRIQATCSTDISPSLFHHLGFQYEGVMKSFGPNGETCYMYARVFR